MPNLLTWNRFACLGGHVAQEGVADFVENVDLLEKNGGTQIHAALRSLWPVGLVVDREQHFHGREFSVCGMIFCYFLSARSVLVPRL